jgi:hypothetical protein
MRKIVDEQLAALESSEYDVAVNLHSSITAGIRCIQKTDPVRKLVMLGRNSETAYDAILQTMGTHIDAPVDEEYESPLDVCLAALLLVVVEIDPTMASFAAANVLRHPNTWWARAVAHSHLLNQEVTHDRVRQSA